MARAFRIARALVEAGCDAEVIIGGELPSGFATGGVPITRLPPVRAPAGGLSSLVHPDGRDFDADAKAHRRDALLAHVKAREPDILVIEAFPFGRRQMRFELLPLLAMVDARSPRPLVVSSVRDILQANRRPERITETLDLIARYFDRVLVHGDSDLARLEASFPAAATVADKLVYTGLVAPTPPEPLGEMRFDVVVSVGGGAVGRALLEAALAARPRSVLAQARWLVLTGPNLPAGDAGGLSSAEGLTILPFVPDLARVLAGARLSISQAGYNTVADVLVAGCRAVLVPYAQDGETEQTVRAEMLAAHGRAAVVSENELDGVTLARAIAAALDAPLSALPVRLDGAAQTAAILQDLLAVRGQSGPIPVAASGQGR